MPGSVLEASFRCCAHQPRARALPCYHGAMSDSCPPRPGGTSLAKGDHYHHPDLREAMIRVAQDLLEIEGPGGWTVRAAARSAGVSSGAPYRHFADKDALIAAVAARGFEDLRAQLETHLARANDSPQARLQALGEAYVSFALSRPGRYSVMFGRPVVDERAHAELKVSSDRTFATVVAEVRLGQVAGILRDDLSGEELTAAAWSMAHGLADLLLSGRLDTVIDTDAPTLTARLGRMMFEGLLARGI